MTGDLSLMLVSPVTQAGLTCLLLLVIGELLDRAAVAEAADGTGEPFPQSVPGAFGPWRAGLQRAEGRLRLQVCH